MAETPDNAEAAELHQVSVELWLIGRRDEALLAFRQALGGESDAIALQLRDTLPNSYDDPDAKRYLMSNVGIQCYETVEHQTSMAIAGWLLFFYIVGVPSLIVYVTTQRTPKELDEKHYRVLYGFLYNGYALDFAWWEARHDSAEDFF